MLRRRGLSPEISTDIALISILLLVFCVRIWNFGIVHHDDAVWALWTFKPDQDPAGDWARVQGRIYAFPYGAMMLHTLAWLGTTYGELLRVGSFAIFFALFLIFVAVYCGRRVALLSSCFFFAFFALRWEESCLTAGPLAPWVLGSVAMIGALLAHAYMRRGRIALAIGAALCLFVSLFNNEAMSLFYCALFGLVIIWTAFEDMATRPSLRAMLSEFIRPGRTRTLVIACGAAVFGYAAVFITWRLFHPTHYDGHVLAPFSVVRIATVASEFVTSNSILRDILHPYRVNFTDVIGSGTSVEYRPSTFIRTLIWAPTAVMFGFIVAYHFSRAAAARASNAPLKTRAFVPELFAATVGLALAVLPMLPPAATAKYQGWYYNHGTTSFSTAIFSYFGLSLLLAAAASALLRRVRARWWPWLMAAPVLAIGVIAAVSYRMNDEIARDMRFESGRWRVLAAAVESIRAAQLNVAALWVPRFKNGSWFTVVEASYWSDYAKARYNADLRFLDAMPPSDMLRGTAYLDYFLADDNTSYITVVARLRAAETAGSARALADKIALQVERPDAALLRNARLTFMDAQGMLQQIPLKDLTPLDRKGRFWLLDKIAAVPSSIQITHQSYLKRELRSCATSIEVRYTIYFGTNQPMKDWDCQGTFFLQSGWGPPEPGGVWTYGREARLSIRAGGPSGAVSALVFDLSTYTGMGFARGTQTIKVYLNDQLAATWAFTSGVTPPWTRVAVPPGLTDPTGRLDIRFEIDPPLNPKTLGIANEDRDLGVTLRSVRIEAAP